MTTLDAIPVLEWSGGAVRVFDPVNHKTFLAESLGDALQALGNPKSVGLAIGRRSSLVRQLTLPEVNQEQAAAIVRVQLDQLFPVSAADLTSDFAFAHRQNGTGKKVVVSAMRTELLQQAKHELAAHGAHAAWVAPISAASGAVALAGGLESAVVVEESVDGTGIDIIQNGDVYYSRSAPPDLGESDLELEVQRTLASAKVPPSTILRADPNGNLATLARTRPAINLELLGDVKRRQGQLIHRRRSLASLLLLVVVSCAVMVWLDFDDAAKRVKKQSSNAARSLATAKTNAKIWTDRLAPLEQGMKTLDQAMKPKQSVSDVLYVISSHVPDGIWLTGVTVERGRNMQFRGTAKNNTAVTEFMQALTADPRFRDVRLVFANDGKIGEQGVVLFAGTGHVIGNFPTYTPATQSGVKK